MAGIFISYARSDQAPAERLAEALQAAGHQLWIDTLNIEAGRAFDREIEQAIAQAPCVIVLWTAKSIESDWVRAEAEAANDDKKLIPLIIDGSRPPLRLSRLQSIDFRSWDGSADADCFVRLLSELHRYAVVAGAPATPRRVPKVRRALASAGMAFETAAAERQFAKFYTARFYRQFQAGVLFMSVSYVLFDIADMVNLYTTRESNIFRTVVGAPALVALLGVSFLPVVRRWWRVFSPISVALGLVIAIATMAALNRPELDPPYYINGAAANGFLLFAAVVVGLLPLRPLEAVVCAAMLIFVSLDLRNLLTVGDFDDVVSQSQVVVAGLALLLAAWLRERSARRWFRETGV